jgi:Poly (ADP-ribose) glycohydrolase (PARG), Macro domain fold
MEPTLLDRRDFDAAVLMREHPPRFSNENKRAVFARLLGPGDVPRGIICLSRWDEAALPRVRPASRPMLTQRSGFFVYGERARPGTLQWHVNFAMSDCFGAYAGPLLAQDELQVLEHPALASLREAANAQGFAIRCVERGRPTPVLVAGVERRGALDTRLAPGRAEGLYGNAFARASRDAVLAALSRVEPTTSNIIAIEAPACGVGRYRREEIALIVSTAFSGFRAAVLETARVGSERTVVHTGFWGSGAYGGNRELMALLQLVAAELAGVDELVFYSVDATGSDVLARAKGRYDSLRPGSLVEQLVTHLTSLGFSWGESNGT